MNLVGPVNTPVRLLTPEEKFPRNSRPDRHDAKCRITISPICICHINLRQMHIERSNPVHGGTLSHLRRTLLNSEVIHNEQINPPIQKFCVPGRSGRLRRWWRTRNIFCDRQVFREMFHIARRTNRWRVLRDGGGTFFVKKVYCEAALYPVQDSLEPSNCGGGMGGSVRRKAGWAAWQICLAHGYKWRLVTNGLCTS
jgi:hypothetical protein